MAEIADTIVKATELSGDYKFQILTATLGSASDTIVLTEAANGISEIVYAKAHLTGGADAALTWLQTAYSGLTITIVSKGEDGGASTNWDGATIEVLVIGK
jgi:hypothetical protein